MNASLSLLHDGTAAERSIVHFRLFNSLIQEKRYGLDRVEGKWKQMKGKVKEQWGKLTDDDLDVINGKREQLEGRLQQRYGYFKDQAQKEVNDWYGRQNW